MTRKGCGMGMGDKFSWERMKSKQLGTKAARDGTGINIHDEMKKLAKNQRRRNKKKKGAKETLMPFGKYRGWRMDRVPRDYLHWLSSRPLNPNLLHAVKDALNIKPLPSSGPHTGRNYIPSEDKGVPFNV